MHDVDGTCDVLASIDLRAKLSFEQIRRVETVLRLASDHEVAVHVAVGNQRDRILWILHIKKCFGWNFLAKRKQLVGKRLTHIKVARVTPKIFLEPLSIRQDVHTRRGMNIRQNRRACFRVLIPPPLVTKEMSAKRLPSRKRTHARPRHVKLS